MRRIVWVVAFDSWQLIRDYRWWLGLAFALVVALVLLRWLLGTFLGHQRCSPWRAHVRAGADALRHQLTTLPPGHGQAGRDAGRPSPRPWTAICGPPASSPPGRRKSRSFDSRSQSGDSFIKLW